MWEESILNETIDYENIDKQSQNTHVEVNIFARQKSKARSRLWIVQNNMIAEKGTCPKLEGNFICSFLETKRVILLITAVRT